MEVLKIIEDFFKSSISLLQYAQHTNIEYLSRSLGEGNRLNLFLLMIFLPENE